MILMASPPTPSLPHAGGGKFHFLTGAAFGQSAFLPPSWGRDGVGGLE